MEDGLFPISQELFEGIGNAILKYEAGFCEAVKEINIEVECIVAINGEDALHKLKNDLRHMPEYIFVDLNMPRMNGVNCLTELKKDPQLKNIPVIIYLQHHPL